MPFITYHRLEFHQDVPEVRRAPLAEFILDVPYLVLHGVIPPRHVLNEVLATGGGDAGMSPGAEWTPFQLDEAGYAALVRELLALDLVALSAGDGPRYVPESLRVDDTLADSADHLEWLRRCAVKYGRVPPAPQAFNG